MDWARSEKFARTIVTHLIEKPIKPGTYWNVNLPHLEESDPDPEFVFASPIHPRCLWRLGLRVILLNMLEITIQGMQS